MKIVDGPIIDDGEVPFMNFDRNDYSNPFEKFAEVRLRIGVIDNPTIPRSVNGEDKLIDPLDSTKIINLSKGKFTIKWLNMEGGIIGPLSYRKGKDYSLSGNESIKDVLKYEQELLKDIENKEYDEISDRELISFTHPIMWANDTNWMGFHYLPPVGSIVVIGFRANNMPVMLGFVQPHYQVLDKLRLGEMMMKGYGNNSSHWKQTNEIEHKAWINQGNKDGQGEVSDKDVYLRLKLKASAGIDDAKHSNLFLEGGTSYSIKSVGAEYGGKIDDEISNKNITLIGAFGIREDSLYKINSAGSESIYVDIEDFVEDFLIKDNDLIVVRSYDINLNPMFFRVDGDPLKLSTPPVDVLEGNARWEIKIKNQDGTSVLSTPDLNLLNANEIVSTNELFVKIKGEVEKNINIDSINFVSSDESTIVLDYTGTINSNWQYVIHKNQTFNKSMKKIDGINYDNPNNPVNRDNKHGLIEILAYNLENGVKDDVSVIEVRPQEIVLKSYDYDEFLKESDIKVYSQITMNKQQIVMETVNKQKTVHPTNNISSVSKITQKIDVFGKNENFIKIEPPIILPNGKVNRISLNQNDKYLAVAHDNTPYISFYSVSENIVKIDGPSLSDLPTGNAKGVSWGGANKVCVIHDNAPYMSVYKKNQDGFIKVNNIDVVPTNPITDCSWDVYGEFLAITYSVHPYFSIYKLEEDEELETISITKVEYTTEQPTGIANSVSWSPDGTYLAIGHEVSPYITIYRKNEDMLEKINLNDIDEKPNGSVVSLDWTKDSVFLLVAHDNSPYFTIYKNVDDVFYKMPEFDFLPSGTPFQVFCSKISNHIFVSHDNLPYVAIYKYRDSNFFHTKELISDSNLSSINGMISKNNGDMVFISHSDNNYFSIYKRNNYQSVGSKKSKVIIEADEIVFKGKNNTQTIT